MNKFCLVFLLANLCAFALADNQTKNAADSSPIMCYQCNEITQRGCKDPFRENPEFLKPCAADEKFCRKIVQTVNDDSSVVRQCAKELYKPNFEGCYKTAGKASQMVCTCKPTDGKPCNNGLRVNFSFVALLSSLLFSVLLLK